MDGRDFGTKGGGPDERFSIVVGTVGRSFEATAAIVLVSPPPQLQHVVWRHHVALAPPMVAMQQAPSLTACCEDKDSLEPFS